MDIIIKTVQEKALLNFKPGQIKSKRDESEFKPDVILVCGIVSSTFNGSLAICFSESLFNLISDHIVGEADTSDDSDPGNKLLHLIHKKSSIELEKKRFSIQQFIPLVLRGKNLKTEEIILEPLLIIPFESEKGVYEIQVGLNSD